jgi:hypothetical protein
MVNTTSAFPIMKRALIEWMIKAIQLIQGAKKPISLHRSYLRKCQSLFTSVIYANDEILEERFKLFTIHVREEGKLNLNQNKI